MIFVSLRIWRRRLIGIVRIVEMNPDKMRTGRMRRHPFFCALHHIHAAPLDSPEAGFRLRMLWEVVIKIESAIKTRSQRFAIKDDSPDKCRGMVALLFQQLRPSRMGGGKRYGKI